MKITVSGYKRKTGKKEKHTEHLSLGRIALAIGIMCRLYVRAYNKGLCVIGHLYYRGWTHGNQMSMNHAQARMSMLKDMMMARSSAFERPCVEREHSRSNWNASRRKLTQLAIPSISINPLDLRMPVTNSVIAIPPRATTRHGSTYV